MKGKLSGLIERGENEKVEFKKSTSQLEAALRSVCAFLNHNGGTVYFGIDKSGNKSGKIIGQEVSDQTIKSISQKIRQKIKPGISPEIKVLEIQGKNIIRVKINKGTNKPYYLNGIAYKRVGTENVVIPPEELEKIIIEKKRTKWDEEVCEEASLKDIDEEKVRWFVREGNKQHRLRISDNIPFKDALLHLDLIKNNKITNVAALLFGKNPQKFFIQSEIKCISLSTTEFAKPYDNYQTYGGNLFEQANKSISFIFENIHRPLWVEPSQVAAKYKYEIPGEAIREAIINAIIHRDYNNPSKIQIRVFPDRVEIWNPGQLPPQIEINDLKKPHPSIPHNPLLFRQFYRIAYVEDVGGGTIDILRKCKEAGLFEPEFKQEMGNFITVLWRSVLTDEHLESLGLNERQKKVINHIKKYGKITRSEYEELYSVSSRTANRELSELFEKKLILKRGKGPDTHYILARYGKTWRDKKISKNDAKT